jgi:L-serine dehydratase
MKFNTFKELLAYCEKKQSSIGQAALALELAHDESQTTGGILSRVQILLDQMEATIQSGLASDEKSLSGLSGGFAQKVYAFKDAPNTFLSGFEHRLIAYALATLEENSRMRRIVACPTAGGSGSVPAVLIALKHEKPSISDETLQYALLGASLTGQIVSHKMHLSGAAAGCQAEIGVACGMAALALTEAMGGSPKQAMDACAFAFQNFIGLACDPVAGLVEVPCVNRNGISAVMASAAATMALAGMPSFLPVDDVVDAMASVGRMMSPKLKESAEGGLAKTKTAIAFTEKFKSET